MDICRDALCARRSCESNMTRNTAILVRAFRPDSAGFTVAELLVPLAVVSILVPAGSLGAATAAGVLRVQNSSATGSLDVCVSPSGRIRVQGVGAACP